MGKLIVLILLGLAAVLGWMVWRNLNPAEKQAVEKQTQSTWEDTKAGLQRTADKLSGPIKDAIHKNLMEPQPAENTPNEKSPLRVPPKTPAR